MSGLIGKKLGMTSIYDSDNKAVACTVIEVGPCVVTQLKNTDNDGYNAVQIGFDTKREKNTTQALLGHFKKANTVPKRMLKEFDFNPINHKLGEILSVSLFKEGDIVDIVGTSKGKGFQGVVKRHGFHGVGGRTHGQHNRGRAPGSMGAGSFPSRVIKGKKLGGHMGDVRVKVQNLKVLKVLPENNIIVISGAIPGSKGTYILIQK